MLSTLLKNIHRRVPVWFQLLAVVVGAAILLTACGGTNTPGAGAASAPTSAAQTPTPTPTATAAPSTPVPGSTQVLTIVNASNGSFGFSPITLTIRVGTTVIWKNMSSAAHTVTSDDGQTFDSGTVPAGGLFRFTFRTTGTFPYHCNYHPYMRATIVVV